LVSGDGARTLTIVDVATPRTPNTRATDSDRVEICGLLDSVLDEGQLSTAEHRGGWGDSTDTSAKDSDDKLVDLGKFDPKAIVAVFRGAPQTLGIKQADVKTSYLDLEPARDPTAPDPVTVTVYVSSDFGSGFIAMSGDGTVKQINYPSS
jgi:hypothetical protein